MKLKSLEQHIFEKYSGDSISIFDIDDTICISSASIIVYDPIDNTEHRLSPAEYNKYEHQPHHHLDFSEFDDGELLLNAQLIEWVFNILRNTMKKEKAVGIITARSDKNIILDFFKKHKVKINPDFIFTVTSPSSKYTGSIAARKKQAFEDLIKMGFKDFKFFDDNEENLEHAKELENEYDIKMQTKHIKEKWRPKFNHEK